MFMGLFERKWPTNKSYRGMVAREILVIMVNWSMGSPGSASVKMMKNGRFG
jgi:hypothetical protein